MPIELRDTIHFDSIREDRGPYFVTYSVPLEGYWFAMVSITFLEASETANVVATMEREATEWLRRFSVAVFVTAFDDTDSVIDLQPAKASNHVLGWLENERVVTHWGAETPPSAPSQPFTIDRLIQTYPGLSYRIHTIADKENARRQTARDNRAILTVAIVWLVAIPVGIALITQFVEWAGCVATGISVATGGWKLLKLFGVFKPSDREKQKEAENLKMRHHHYYCERNPEGFSRLMVEVLEQESRERTRKEAEEIKSTKHNSKKT